MFDQILTGKRQTGKSTWLIERAHYQTLNVERNSLIVVVGSNTPMASVLVDRIESRLGKHRLVWSEANLASSIRGMSPSIARVVILCDEIQLYSEKLERKIFKIKETLALVTAPSTEYFVYGTATFGEEIE